MSREITIQDRRVGDQCPVYIVAEMSANHGRNIDRAHQIIEAAADAGADAIKLQTYTADTITIDCANDYFRVGKGTLWEGRNLYNLYEEAYTPWEWHAELQAAASHLGMDFFSTPFDDTAVAFLEDLKVPVHKVASFELVDIPLLESIGATGKPVIMSTGMGSLEEIDEAVATLRKAGTQDLVLLKCTSAYPSLPEDMDLRTIPDIAERFKVPVGLSDHTLGTTVPVAAVALGACVIEKHFTLSREDGGPDAAFSLEPAEFREMVDAVRITEKALGSVNYSLSEKEQASRVFRRSLFVVKTIEAGEAFSAENVRSIRPGYGMHTRHLKEVIGRKAAVAIPAGTPLADEHLT
jgi:pseudaminic acid synthase